MSQKDPRVDEYIARSADFARPILEHLRALVHDAVPEVEETMKWSSPHFMYKGMLCSMASFKSHCAFGFWKGNLLFQGAADRSAMGHFGRIASLQDLPPDRVLRAYVRKAAALNDKGIKTERKRARAKTLEIPDDFGAALRRNKQARASFDSFTYSHKKEYVDWVTEAKTEATRQKRLATAVGWIAQGKSRHWKYG